VPTVPLTAVNGYERVATLTNISTQAQRTFTIRSTARIKYGLAGLFATKTASNTYDPAALGEGVAPVRHTLANAAGS
jgi:hypothetical protein